MRFPPTVNTGHILFRWPLNWHTSLVELINIVRSLNMKRMGNYQWSLTFYALLDSECTSEKWPLRPIHTMRLVVHSPFQIHWFVDYLFAVVIGHVLIHDASRMFCSVRGNLNESWAQKRQYGSLLLVKSVPKKSPDVWFNVSWKRLYLHDLLIYFRNPHAST